MKNIAVFVSGGGTNLGALIAEKQKGNIKNGEIKIVVSSKDGAYALTRAENANIPTLVLPRKNYKTNAEYSVALRDALEKYNIDLVVLAGFMCILTKEFISRYENKIINVHPSLIPEFCGDGFYGIHVHEAVLAAKREYSGATVHFVNEICDGGAIILQKKIKVAHNDTPNRLQKRIMLYAEQKILPKAIELFCDDKLKIVNGKVEIV